ncbi:hypothetical protein Bca52824_091496 [Brassica carinata]|uniref:Uncharacterized protein n=1 Tax=Brassica carinata TaxID=52824 RepID=A0A8X7TFD3_BRACI|nr:hypothetical protein Bca52824_091496 [Brassica carinata]
MKRTMNKGFLNWDRVKKAEPKLLDTPRNYEASLKDAKVPNSASTDQLRSDVFLKPKNLNNGHIKSWVDEKNSNFMLYPRNLSITWSDDPNYWTWFPDKESPNEAGVEAVALKNVCWLDITGKFDTNNLTPGITYEVVFTVKLEDPAYGWDTPVNIKLVLPNSKDKPQEQKVSLREIPRYQWVDIIVGEFKPEKNSAGEITFSMYEHESGVWKKGLFLKGVGIFPKY